MSTSRHDAGLRAVARVRSLRERDSLLGLHASLSEERAADQRVAELDGRLTTWSAPDGTAAAFLAARTTGAALATDAAAARSAAATAHTFTLASRDHWQRDRTRLSAVELLLERRAAERRAEAVRREEREADELTTARWLRDHSTSQEAAS